MCTSFQLFSHYFNQWVPVNCFNQLITLVVVLSVYSSYKIFYFTFTIWDLGFKTSTDGQTRSEFQDLDKRIDEIWVSGPRQTNRRDLGFRTSTDGQMKSGFQDLNRRTNRIQVSRPRQTDSQDLGFRTSTNGQTESGFQDPNRLTDTPATGGVGRRGWRGCPLLHQPLPSPTPQNLRHKHTQGLTKLIY